MGRPLTHTPSPLSHTFRRVCSTHFQVTLPPFTGTQHTQEGHTNTLSELKPTHGWRGSQALRPHVHPGSHRVTHFRTGIRQMTVANTDRSDGPTYTNSVCCREGKQPNQLDQVWSPGTSKGGTSATFTPSGTHRLRQQLHRTQKQTPGPPGYAQTHSQTQSEGLLTHCRMYRDTHPRGR